MPIKKDETGKHWVEMEFITPGTPEQVWRAIATGSGNTAWFTKTTIDEHVGGRLHFDFGPNGASTGEVTIWEPPFRFGYVEREWSEGAPPVATEITVTSRSGDHCVVRMVHSLFASTDDWDDQLEGFESGWHGFFEVLRVYLSHFAGEKAASFSVMANTQAGQLSTWRRLTETLGLAGANVGEERSGPQQPERLSGMVERVRQDDKQRFVVLRLNAPAPGIALIGTYGTDGSANASMALYLYGDDAEQRAAEGEPKWRNWFGETFKHSR
ncbi:SRPBCC domain-containing protein [Mesorhizobium sp.]|uniref:SRPBCC family protein n=2 Tax=Mesorhizobium sp. TaxID=1871066 RepID=UPI000FEA5F4B|nr:SRPBCC domain-containing protein [Mesorhizobium sp.]RWE70737.1 MAG: SRPBCC domain-containing protein [Mesorhizobium sp.]